MEVWLRYDLRTPPFGPSRQTMCATAIDQVAWSEGRGFTTAFLGEHHGTDDGYLPSPFVLAAAMASRTSTLRLHCMVMLPLLSPLRVAEDLAVLDVLSAGRAEMTVGIGYVPSEFEMFGVEMADRARLVDEGCAALRSALSGEPFTYRGRRCRVTPQPVQEPGVPVYIGGAVPATARRAAALGDGFFPTVATSELFTAYEDECNRLGRPVGRMIDSTGPLAIHVTDDPERAWAQIGHNYLYEMNCYGKWASEAAAATGMQSPFSEVTDVDMLAESGVYRIVTPDECVALARAQHQAGRVLMFSPLAGGVDPDLAWQSLELFAGKVLPRLS